MSRARPPDSLPPDAPPPTLPVLLDALDVTWPPAGRQRLGPWLLREGRGGGKRVSAARAEAPVRPGEIDTAEAAMRAMGQRPLFQLRPEAVPHDHPLDAALADRGYALVDRTVLCRAPVARLAPDPLPVMRVFPIWPPLAIQRDIWAETGIGPSRLAVMARAEAPRAALLARQADRAAGTAFVACHGDVAMLHAMAVTPALRRRGAARNLTLAAAEWAAGQGARWLALAVTRDNAPARALYAALGMEAAGGYHYRMHPQESPP